jgi:hypothetical protein
MGRVTVRALVEDDRVAPSAALPGWKKGERKRRLLVVMCEIMRPS